MKNIIKCGVLGIIISSVTLNLTYPVYAEENAAITGDIDIDVANGLLFTNKDGEVCDKDGELISEYSGYSADPFGTINDAQENYVSGYHIGAGGKIYSNDEYEKYSDSQYDYDYHGSLYSDMNAGRLYTNLEGQVCDPNGNVLSEYEIYHADGSGCLFNENGDILDCYIGGGGKLYTETAALDYYYDYGYDEDEDNDDTYDDQTSYYAATPIETLRNAASEFNCDTNVINENNATWMEDDGSCFDEIVLKAWYDEYGNPRADYPPRRIMVSVSDNGMLAGLSYMHFIDGENLTMQQIQRSKSGTQDCYVLVLTNITKRSEKDGNGISMFDATEYTSKMQVVIHGNFDGILNGDSLLMFASFTGLGSDDTPNFGGAYAEIINDRNLW